MKFIRLTSPLIICLNIGLAMLFAVCEAWLSVGVSLAGAGCGMVGFYSAGRVIDASRKARQ